MERIIGGYTIIEVMIFLAISSILFVSAVIAVGGQQAHTEFSASMRDIDSKMQDWINQVVTGLSGSTAQGGSSPGNYGCILDSDNRPILVTATTERGANPQCIFIGKAIQVNTEPQYNNQLTVYPVLGRRTYLSGSEQLLVSSLAEANPAPAISDAADLTETYFLQNGARIKSVTSGPGLGDSPASRMIGFFLSFNTESNTSRNGSESLNTKQFSLTSNQDPGSNPVKNCLKLITTGLSACSTPPVDLQNWRLCFESTRNSDTATLTVSSTNGQGAAVKLEFAGC